jgi:hypothetical protein
MRHALAPAVGGPSCPANHRGNHCIYGARAMKLWQKNSIMWGFAAAGLIVLAFNWFAGLLLLFAAAMASGLVVERNTSRTKPLVKPTAGYPPEHATTDAIKRHIDHVRPPE